MIYLFSFEQEPFNRVTHYIFSSSLNAAIDHVFSNVKGKQIEKEIVTLLYEHGYVEYWCYTRYEPKEGLQIA